jgi:ATP-dependent protease HslVU (ClpYQ) peptidase subunit
VTTIAWRRPIMAADSSCFVGDTHVLTMRKVWRVGGGLVGCAGDVAEIFAFVRWLKDGADKDDYPEMKNIEAIVVDPFGTARAYEGETSEPMVIRNEYCAIGSGRDVALGAMFAGADARMAVRAAVRHTGQSKPPVRVYRLKERT